MHIRVFHLCTLSLLASNHFFATASLSLPPITSPLNITHQSFDLQNQTLTLPPRPDAFSLTYEIGGPKLRSTACLMNAVDALKTLALGDWTAKIIDGTEYRLDRFPEVSFLVNTQKRDGSVEARFVVWAIVLGVGRMIRQKRFEFAQFEMRWGGGVVGWVHFVDNPSGRTLDVEKRVNTMRAANATEIVDGVTTDAANDSAEARLVTTFTPTGSTLGIYDVFLPILNALSDLATYPATHRSEGLVAGFKGMKGIICILPVGTVEYQWLIRALARIPTFMLGERRFGELSITMAVDGVEVAFGKVGGVEGCV